MTTTFGAGGLFTITLGWAGGFSTIILLTEAGVVILGYTRAYTLGLHRMLFWAWFLIKMLGVIWGYNLMTGLMGFCYFLTCLLPSIQLVCVYDSLVRVECWHAYSWVALTPFYAFKLSDKVC